MIIIECIGRCKDDMVIDYINGIYKDNKKLGNFSEEFCSVALNVLNDELNSGDKFRIRILDNKGNTLDDNEYIFKSVNGGTLYYE